MIFFLIAALVGPRLGVVPIEIIERPGGALVGAPIVVQGVMATAVTVLAAAAQPLTVAAGKATAAGVASVGGIAAACIASGKDLDFDLKRGFWDSSFRFSCTAASTSVPRPCDPTDVSTTVIYRVDIGLAPRLLAPHSWPLTRGIHARLE